MAVLNSIVVLLLCGLDATVVFAADDPTAKREAEASEMRRRMEASITRFSHFATDDIVANRPTKTGWPENMIAEQAELSAQLQKWSRQPEALRTLLDDHDPKVRTLALGALFVREDPHDLPLIASLADDNTPTFPLAHSSFNSSPQIDPKEIVTPQTVGQAAGRFLEVYLRAAHCKPNRSFAEYWSRRKSRTTCASWFLVKTERATRNISPFDITHQQDLQRVMDEIKRLPAPDRAWTQVYLRCLSFTDIGDALTDEMCVAVLKQVGPDQIIRFLKRQRVTDDPDLEFDELDPESSRVYSFMSHFLLNHVRDLLRAQDAPTLLACEEFERKSTSRTLIGASPSWAAAAAELIGESDPAAARKIIEAALERFPLSNISGGREQAVLIGRLWRIEGLKEKRRIVDWFYKAQAKVVREKSDESNHGCVDLLRSVRAAKRPNTDELMLIIIEDSRFDQIDLPAMKELLETVGYGLSKPLVSREELSGADGRAGKLIARWQEILRRRFQR